MKGKEKVTLVEIIEEIAKENGEDFSEYDLSKKDDYAHSLKNRRKEYIKTNRNRFKEFVKIQGLDIEDYRQEGSSEYVMPLEEKPYIKALLKMYATKKGKKIRENKIDNFTIEEVVEFVEAVQKEMIKISKSEDNSYNEDLNINQLNEMNKYGGSKTLLEISEEVETLVQLTMRDLLKADELVDGRLLDKDIEVLLLFYREILIALREAMQSAAYIYKEYRDSDNHERNIEIHLQNLKNGNDTYEDLIFENPANLLETMILDEVELKGLEGTPIEELAKKKLNEFKQKYSKRFP